jgi:hypothetical protein
MEIAASSIKIINPLEISRAFDCAGHRHLFNSLGLMVEAKKTDLLEPVHVVVNKTDENTTNYINKLLELGHIGLDNNVEELLAGLCPSGFTLQQGKQRHTFDINEILARNKSRAFEAAA